MFRDSTDEWSPAAAAYDAIASRYDRIPEENRINAYMRRISLNRILTTFRGSTLVLEIGCGTGDEALSLAALGTHVVAIDPSEQMVALAQEKAKGKGLDKMTTFFRISASEIGELMGRFDQPMDGAYASFSLGYERDLSSVARPLHQLLRPFAVFLASVPSRVCLVELLISGAMARPQYAGRRLKAPHGHKVGSHVVPIWTYTPTSLSAAFSPLFHLQSIEAIPAVVPPPYFNRWYARLTGLADGIENLDEGLRKRFPFRAIGDHFLARLERRP